MRLLENGDLVLESADDLMNEDWTMAAGIYVLSGTYVLSADQNLQVL